MDTTFTTAPAGYAARTATTVQTASSVRSPLLGLPSDSLAHRKRVSCDLTETWVHLARASRLSATAGLWDEPVQAEVTVVDGKDLDVSESGVDHIAAKGCRTHHGTRRGRLWISHRLG